MPASGQPFGLRDVAVRRCLLAVVVVHDIDLSWVDPDPDASGWPDLQLDGPDPIAVPAARVAAVLADRELEHPGTVALLARWLRLRRTLHALPIALVLEGLRAVGLPAEHVSHPGPDWTRATVPGAALTLGLGLVAGSGDEAAALGPEPGDLLGGAGPIQAIAAPAPVPLPAGLLEEIGVDPAAVWPAALARLEELGGLAAARRRRRPRDPLRPLAEADVVSLLGSRRFRFALASETPSGLAGLVVPMLTRGWVSNSSIDSAFGPAAAAATTDEQRGFPRPLLVTEYEVVQVPEGGHPLRYLGGQQQRSPWS
jgi:hypothetical protein